MYMQATMEDTLRIPAEFIRKGQSLNQRIDELASEAFEGKYDSENRFVLVTYDHEPIGRGRIIHGDGAIYQKVKFKAILFVMLENEVIEGAISEVHDFGCFIRIGPVEALLHKSQIMDDHVDVRDGQERKIVGRTSGKELGVGNPVRSRIVSLSFNPADPKNSKIGLTCKQPGLGGLEWLKEER